MVTKLAFDMFRGEPWNSRIKAIIIDEAHCVVTWGEHFRPCFRQLKDLRAVFPNATTLALTATASVAMQKDIARELNLLKYNVVAVSPDRPNIKLVVKRRPPRSGGCRTAEEAFDAIVLPIFHGLGVDPDTYPKTIVFAKLKWCGYGHEEAMRPFRDGKPTVVGKHVAQFHAPCTSQVRIMYKFSDAI